MKDIPSPVSLVFTPAQHVDYESDLEKLDESALEEGSLDEGALDEGAVVSKSDQEDAVVGKSDQEDVENSHTLSCVNCDAEMTPDHQCDSDEQRFTKYLMRWSQRLEERTDDSALKSRLLESLVDAYHTPELHSWHTPVSALDLKDVKNQFLEGDLPPVQFLEELQSLLRRSE